MNKVIYSAFRGEGKSTWLIDRIAETIDGGREAYYIGSRYGFFNLREKCRDAGIIGLKYMSECIPGAGFDVFTDEFMDEFINIPHEDLAFCEKLATTWYITIPREMIIESDGGIKE